MIGPNLLAREVVDVHLVAVLVEVLQDLLAHDLLLGCQAPEGRLRGDLAEDAEARPDRLGREHDLVKHVVGVGRRVERAAEALDGAVERVRRRPALGAAKQHVLDQVAQAVGARGLVARAGAAVQDQRHPVQVGLLDGDQP